MIVRGELIVAHVISLQPDRLYACVALYGQGTKLHRYDRLRKSSDKGHTVWSLGILRL